MQLHLKKPKLPTLKAVYFFNTSSIFIHQNHDLRSKQKNVLHLPNSPVPPVFWAGGRSVFNASIQAVKSMQNHNPPSFFCTDHTTLHQALWLGCIVPNSNISCRLFRTSSTNGGRIHLNCSLKGVSSVTFIYILYSGYSPILLEPARTHRGTQPGASRWHLSAWETKSPTPSNPIH